MRAGMTSRSSLLVRSFWRIRKPRPIARPHLLPHHQNPMSVLPSGPMANGPAHRRRLPSSLKPPYIGELWNVPSVSLCVRFPTFCVRKAYQLFFLFDFLSAMPLYIHSPHRLVPTPTLQPSLPHPAYATPERTLVCHTCGRLSIIPRTLTTRGVATRRYARNALSKSSDPSRRQLI